jgi:hypothetical protein
LALSASGTLVYSDVQPLARLVWLDESNTQRPLLDVKADYHHEPALSPDGKRVAVALRESGNTDLWVYEWERDQRTRLTFVPGGDSSPVWTPDGKYVVFSSTRHGGVENLYAIRSDGAGETIRLTEKGNPQYAQSFSPHGKYLVFFEVSEVSKKDLWILPVEFAERDHPKPGKPRPLLGTPADESFARLSPDGQWLAYSSDASGTYEVYVRRFSGTDSGTDVKWQISSGGGNHPVWSGNGRQLFYVSDQGMMVTAYATSGKVFVPGKPRVWVEKRAQTLFKGSPGSSGAGNVCYMGPFCMGNVPQRFSVENIGAFLYTLYEWGFFGNSAKWSWFWIAGIGEIVLKPFDLYEAFNNPNNNYIEPSNFFSLSAAHVAASITPDNPSLDSSQFYLCRPNRPSLIVNTNVLQNYLLPDSPQIPVQGTPVASGIPGASPDGTIAGGGAVESFAFTSTLTGPGTADTAFVSENRRYSLCDIAGCSSAFFAEFLLQYLNQEIDQIVAELEQYLINSLGFSEWLADLIGTAVEDSAESFLDAESSKVIPQYNYWPLGKVSQGNAANTVYRFSDGGDFDNTGILGLLAQTGADRIIAFLNTETPLSIEQVSGEVVVSSDVPPLFGYQGTMVNGQYVSFGGMSPSRPMSYVQVFSDSDGAFAALCQGLYNASCAGSSLGTATASFLQTLTTVANPVANIESGRNVTVLWIYNNRVNNWQNAITDGGIKADLSLGQQSQPGGRWPTSRTTLPGCRFFSIPRL